MKAIDLHVHTTTSDGTLSPSEVVRLAKRNGLSAIAITDHDTIDGIAEALIEAKKVDLEIIAGIEISANFQPEMHLLGYFFGGKHLNIKDNLLQKLRYAREQRNIKSIGKLIELGIDISQEEVKQEAPGKIVARPHIAAVLFKKGYVSSVKEAYNKYLAEGALAYFSKGKLTPEEGIEEILKAGGMPVMAHPLTLGLSFDKLDCLLSKLKKAGLMGVETYYSEHTAEETRMIAILAEKHRLLLTGGSDFHGKAKPQIMLGKGYGNLFVPYELLEKMKKLSE